MATYLYRLGRLAARRAWAFVLAWILVLAGVGGAAAAFSKPLSTEITIPGTEFNDVLVDLHQTMPKSAGGSGVVVFRTKDGTPFTAAQQAAVATATKAWASTAGVAEAPDPFATQAEIDSGASKLATGKKQLTDGARQLHAKQSEVTKAAAQLAGFEKALNQQAAQIAAEKKKAGYDAAAIALQEQALAGGRTQVAAGTKQLADGRAQLAAAQAKLDASAAEIDRGERRLALMKGLRQVSADKTAAVTRLAFTTSINTVPKTTMSAIPTMADKALAGSGVTVDYSQDLQGAPSSFGAGEIVGVAVAGLVLLVMLGSLLAAGLPLLTALIGVAVGVLGAVASTHWFELTNVAPILAVMLGLAVGIDYALFLVNRHREQLARGVELHESIGRASGTAGSAVVVAGMTVIVALAALTMTGIPFLGSMGLAAAFTVAVAVLVSITLTPALLRLIGTRVLSPRSRKQLLAKLDQEDAEIASDVAEHHGGAADPVAHRGHGWGGLVTRHPIVTLIAATALLAVMALPALSLRLGLPSGATQPSDSSAYRTYSTIADKFGPGQNAAMLAVAQVDPAKATSLSDTAVADLELAIGERLLATPGVEYVVPAGANADHTRLLFQVVPTTGPVDVATAGLVDRLHEKTPSIVSDTGVTSLRYAGATVADIEMADLLARALPLYLSIVVGISLLLLLLVFRSLVVPLLATAGFLLSIAAAFGSVVAVYQWGWLGSLFGVDHPGPVLSFLPTLTIGIVFGLAMDYQMFLVSGMREAWAHGESARGAVRTGFSHGARVVTAAALIMTSVFASFIFSHQAMIRPVGFGLAIGVLLDAFVVRMTAMPAIMHLLGERAWYIPRWLDRILPNLDVEGTSLLTHLEAEKARAATDSPAEPVASPA